MSTGSLGRPYGLIHSMPAYEATLIARVRQRLEPAFECLEGRVAVEEHPGRVAAHRALPRLVDDRLTHSRTVDLPAHTAGVDLDGTVQDQAV